MSHALSVAKSETGRRAHIHCLDLAFSQSSCLVHSDHRSRCLRLALLTLLPPSTGLDCMQCPGSLGDSACAMAGHRGPGLCSASEPPGVGCAVCTDQGVGVGLRCLCLCLLVHCFYVCTAPICACPGFKSCVRVLIKQTSIDQGALVADCGGNHCISRGECDCLPFVGQQSAPIARS